MKIDKKILESISKGIHIALDDYELDDIENISSKSNVVKNDEYVRDLIRYTELRKLFDCFAACDVQDNDTPNFLNEEELDDESNKTKAFDKLKVKGNIKFEHVVFGYDKDKTIIKDFTSNIKPASKIAIVGPTGAGKTTIVNLLMKFYEINSGDIKIDGVSIKDLSRENIHSLFTMVLQDTWLFNGTVKENIVYKTYNTNHKALRLRNIIQKSHQVRK